MVENPSFHHRGKENRLYRVPVGVVGVISPLFSLQPEHALVAPLWEQAMESFSSRTMTLIVGGTLLAKIFEELVISKGPAQR